MISNLNTKKHFETFGAKWGRYTVYNWVQKAELRPTSGAAPGHITVDETVIQVNDERRRLYATLS